MSNIFLSHAEEDRELAKKLKGDLEAIGIQVWLYEVHMLPGDELVGKIVDAIRENDYLGVIISPEAMNSNWVMLEIGMALTLEQALGYSKVIPILKGDCEIPVFLKHKVYVDLHSDYNGGIENLAKTLKTPARKRIPKSDLAFSVESFEELQHEANTIAEHFRLFKEECEIQLERQLREIDEDHSRRGMYFSGVRFEARTRAEQDTEREIGTEKVKAAYKIERIRLQTKRLYSDKEIAISEIFRK